MTGDEVVVAAVELAHDGSSALLELAERLGSAFLCVGVARLQGVGDAGRDLGRDLDGCDRVAQKIGEAFLSDIGVAARTLEAGAAVIDVPALLHLRRQGAATVQQAHEGMTPLPRSHAGLAVQDLLHPIEGLASDQRFVRPATALPEPEEIAGVDRIPEHAMDLGRRQATVAAVVAEADLEGLRREGLQRVMA